MEIIFKGEKTRIVVDKNDFITMYNNYLNDQADPIFLDINNMKDLEKVKYIKNCIKIYKLKLEELEQKYDIKYFGFTPKFLTKELNKKIKELKET